MNSTLFHEEDKKHSCPTTIEDKLVIENSSATSIKFSRRGDYLAVGCFNGDVLVIDFETLTTIRHMKGGHKRYNWKGDMYDPCISNVVWSSCGRYVVSCAWDRRVVVWDVEEGRVHHVYIFNSGVKFVDSHPYRNDILISPWWDVPFIVTDLEKKTEKKKVPYKKICTEINGNHDYLVTRYSVEGSKIFIGNSRGEMWVYDSKTLEEITFIDFWKNNDNGRKRSPIHDFTFSETGHFMLVNTGERISLFHMETGIAMGEFFDSTQPDSIFQHNCIGFSGYSGAPEKDWDSDYMFASLRGSKNVLIWDRETAKLVTIIEGPKENITCVEWHPREPCLLTSSTHNTIYIWRKTFMQGWSAFAPKFTVLAKTEKYIEEEEEFDNVSDTKKLDNMLNPLDIDDTKRIVLFSKPKKIYSKDENLESVYFSTKPKLIQFFKNKRIMEEKKKLSQQKGKKRRVPRRKRQDARHMRGTRRTRNNLEINFLKFN